MYGVNTHHNIQRSEKLLGTRWGGATVSSRSRISGAGTITHSSSAPMTARADEPADAESYVITAETANSVYSVVASAASTTFVQLFWVTDARSMIRKAGDNLHSRPSRFAPSAR